LPKIPDKFLNGYHKKTISNHYEITLVQTKPEFLRVTNHPTIKRLNIRMKSIMQEASSIAKAIEQGWIKAGKPLEFTVKVYEEAQKNFIGFTTKSAKIAILFNEQAPTTTSKHPEYKRPLSTESRRGQQQPQRSQQPSRDRESSRDREQRETAPRGRAPHPSRPAPYAKPAETTSRPAPERPNRSEGEERASRQTATVRSIDARAAEQRKEQPAKEQQAPREPKKTEGSGGGEGHGPINVWSSEMVAMAQEWTKQALVLLNKPSLNVTTQVTDGNLMLRFEAPVVEESVRDKVFQRSFAFLVMQMLKNKFKKRFKGLRIILENE